MTFSNALDLPIPVSKFLAAIPPEIPVYLVGGAVRDLLLRRPVHDLDVLLTGDVMGIARRVADSLEAPFYPLDKERNYARVILTLAEGKRLFLDFTPVKNGDLVADLRDRDFTINAMALDVRENGKLVDPCGGAADLHQKVLRVCTPASLREDPVRVLRGVRLAVDLSLRIEPETLSLLREAARLLNSVTPERQRDEIIKILANPQPATAMRLMERLGILPYVFPELVALQGVEQSPPHVANVWDHTLDLLSRLEMLLAVLEQEYDPDKAASLILGLAVLRLGRYRNQVAEHINTQLIPERPLRPLLFLAALYHDVAKPATRQVEAGGRIRFFEHEQLGADLAARRGRALVLSNEEILRLETIVRGHMRPLLLAQAEDQPSRRAVYRYFRKLGAAGIDVSLLSLADTLATYGETLPQETWSRLLEVVHTLWEAYWDAPQKRIAPPMLLSGHDLIEIYKLSPGPKIGTLLEALREAQAVEQVTTMEEALAFVQQLLDQG